MNSILDQVLEVVLTGGGSERHGITDEECSISSTQGVAEILEIDSCLVNMRRYQGQNSLGASIQGSNSQPWLYSVGLDWNLNGTPLQYSCLENPMDRGAWQAAVHGVAKSRTRLSNFTFTFHFHALEKEMATHSSVLAWRIPGTGEPGGLPSMGSHRV